MFNSKVVVPTQGSAIEIDANGKLIVPDNPIVPFIRGDGIGADITPVMQKVVDAAVAKAYSQKKKISWMEIYAGGRSVEVYGDNTWLPDETFDFIRKYHVAIKGPLTTPVGGGIRSLNVALRQTLDLYICILSLLILLSSVRMLKISTQVSSGKLILKVPRSLLLSLRMK